MGITFDKYIDNPNGGAVFTNRQMYKEMYRSKFDAVMLREGGSVKYKIYRDKASYFIKMKIPSEVISDFYYDVVVELYPGTNSLVHDANMRSYFVKFFSNDPAFTFTFAHTFLDHDMFITELKSKMSKEAIKKPAEEKNPNNDIWYVKSLYFAYLAMEKYSLFNKAKLDINSESYNKHSFDDIMPASQKIALRVEEGEKLKKQKQKEREAAKLKARLQKPAPTNSVPITKTSNIATTGKIIASSRKSKTTKKI